MFKKFFISLFLLVVSFIAINIAEAGERLDRVVAIVNDDIITSKELDEKIKIIRWQLEVSQATGNLPPDATLRKQVLNKLILDKIQLQLAKTHNIDTDSNTVNQNIKDMAGGGQLSLEAFKNSLAQHGISYDDFREHIKNELTISTLQQEEVAQNIVIPSSEVDSFLNSPIGQDQTGVEYRLAHILIQLPENPSAPEINQAKQKAVQLITALKNGANFEELAIAESSGQYALKGGDLGWRTVAQLPSIFVNDAPKMQLGQVVGPIKSSSGFHIIRLLDKRIGENQKHNEINLQHILLKTGEKRSDAEAKSMLEEMRKQILAGKSFTEFAKQKSDETSSARSGGNLGWIEKKAVLPDFYTQIIDLNPGEISQPFKTELGWHLVKVVDKRNQSTSKEAYRNQAVFLLKERKFHEILDTWFRKLRDNAKIEILYK
jgi:peptidyl-prolyl cis-trans isomerase SurA